MRFHIKTGNHLNIVSEVWGRRMCTQGYMCPRTHARDMTSHISAVAMATIPQVQKKHSGAEVDPAADRERCRRTHAGYYATTQQRRREIQFACNAKTERVTRGTITNKFKSYFVHIQMFITCFCVWSQISSSSGSSQIQLNYDFIIHTKTPLLRNIPHLIQYSIHS